MTQNIFALLGRYDLKEEGEKNWLRREIAERKPHEEYKYWDLEHSKADADIAVLIMSESVTFTNYIQPICLPTPKDYVFDVSGVIVGYGKPDPYTEHLNTPQFLTMTSVNLTTCLFSNKQSLHTVSPRSFCARSKHGTACLGDSGGGFIKQLQGKWVILGIISHGLDAECSPDDFITFARVNYFLEWLEKNQKKFEGIPVTTRRPTTTAFKPTQTIPTIKTSKPTVAPKKDFFSFSDGELSRVRKPTFQEDFKGKNMIIKHIIFSSIIYINITNAGTTRSPIKPPQKIRLDNKVYPYDPENTEIIFAPMINFYNGNMSNLM